MADKLKPFEFESDEPEHKHAPLTAEECIREINDYIIEKDRGYRVTEDWRRHNDSHMAKIRREQNLIKGMRCLP